MSLSTLLEAAKYLDYLDSNPQGRQQQHDHSMQPQSHSHRHFQKAQPTSAKRSTRRQRSSKKDAANTMIAMSLPNTTGVTQMQHGVPIPLASGNGIHTEGHHASLSSSFTTESPLSSFASTALLCSKASGVTSASSSAASSLSSSDSSSSCGEILMGDNDFNQYTITTASSSGVGGATQKLNSSNNNFTHQQSNNGIRETNNYQMQSLVDGQPAMVAKYGAAGYNDRGQSFARYIAATSNGPQLVTMTTTASGGITSASAPIDGRLRAGHVIHAATQNTSNAIEANFEPHQFSISGPRGRDSQTAFGVAGSLGNDIHLGTSPGSCPPLIMARVQPMILNSISHSTHQSLMAFQPANAAASSPTSSSSSYSRHRELHKTLEKNRRAHLRHCFELLKSELPQSECADRKTSHINIIKSAIRYVLALRQQECEIDNELMRLTKIKTDLTEKLSALRINDDQIQIDQQMEQIEQKQEQHTSLTSPQSPSPSTHPSNARQEQSPQQPAEQQLSFLLSQSKID